MLVSIRNQDAVASFARDGSGLRWVLSRNAHMRSNFSFDRASSAFYNQHHATQLA